MTDKPLKSLNGKKLEGVLGEPIDLISFELVPGLHSQAEIEAYRSRKHRELFDLRGAKIPDLARHLGLDLASDAYRGADGRETLLEFTLMALAKETVIGFQQKREGKWPRARVFWGLQSIDALKKAGVFKNDLTACESLLQAERPELAKRSAKAELKAEAIQFRTRITTLRSALNRAKKLEEKTFHKKPRLRIVK
ncbi:MAG TPA: hypothetical protein VII74_02905 [Chthoniobacterales bacterium]